MSISECSAAEPVSHWEMKLYGRPADGLAEEIAVAIAAGAAERLDLADLDDGALRVLGETMAEAAAKFLGFDLDAPGVVDVDDEQLQQSWRAFRPRLERCVIVESARPEGREGRVRECAMWLSRRAPDGTFLYRPSDLQQRIEEGIAAEMALRELERENAS